MSLGPGLSQVIGVVDARTPVFAGPTNQESRLGASGIDAGSVDGLHQELRIRPLPVLPSLVGAPDPQTLLGANKDYRLTHLALPRLRLRCAARRWYHQAACHHRVEHCSATPDRPGARPALSRSWRCTAGRPARSAVPTTPIRSSEDHRPR